jgi:hypothetical protein
MSAERREFVEWIRLPSLHHNEAAAHVRRKLEVGQFPVRGLSGLDLDSDPQFYFYPGVS